ncbi:hypothetical protein A9P82_12205 [Arachidicoccus ginsenosidimutans]|uniref:alpha/beta hydrolase domain-containing protein n=1 Tax=Arachidicoccus sp. BS20 TaxID=1850526 RepID=UPI0007F09B7D|nr:alpha/beta hydrolase domain-containing protein [Arachidicoccus sp. BS20]ANI89981.1 hypothetical protein A9P82_12205 [Arachidicoccus sp. BS20]
MFFLCINLCSTRCAKRLLISLLCCFAFIVARAGVIRIKITKIESPTFDGRTFGTVGAYEKIIGKVYCEVNPLSPKNSCITDIEYAPKNKDGMVEYSMDFYILKPVDECKGNHKLFFEINNRGGKAFGGFNESGGGNNPTTSKDAGNAFLMKQGYTIAWCGWDISAGHINNNLTIQVPVAKNKDGSSITGQSYEYICFDNPNAQTYDLHYAAETLDKTKATLTVKKHLNDAATDVPSDQWEYINDKKIALLPKGTPFKQSFIYEFRYTAKDPLVAGLSLAATRDFVSFLRYAKADNFGNPNPLAGDIQYTFSYGVSQSARYINDFQTLGFNEDEQGRRVFDGIENWLGGGDGVGINYRFAQPGRTERNRQEHLFPEGIFPFAFPKLKDIYSKKIAGRLDGYASAKNYPKDIEVNSANEYWSKAASLLHSDLNGNDLPDPPNVRFFLISGMQHGTGNGKSKGVCQQFQNPTRAEPVLRALFMDLDSWVTKNIAPPNSMVPRVADGTAAFAKADKNSFTGKVPAKELGWKNIPGVTYTGLITVRHVIDYGAQFGKGIISKYPERPGNKAYKNFVSKVDTDDNEIAGIHTPQTAVPLGTYTSWALRRKGFAENDGGEASGQFIPFAKTKAERLQTHDPRLSLEERYGTHEGYVNAVKKAVSLLETQRLLLKEDGERYVEDAEKSSILK